MAKKKTSRRAAAVGTAEPRSRKGHRIPQDFAMAAEQFKERSGRFRALAQAMAEADLDRVEMDGATKLERGLMLIDEYLILAEQAIKMTVLRRRK